MLVSESNRSVNEHEELENTKKIRNRGKILKIQTKIGEVLGSIDGAHFANPDEFPRDTHTLLGDDLVRPLYDRH